MLAKTLFIIWKTLKTAIYLMFFCFLEYFIRFLTFASLVLRFDLYSYNNENCCVRGRKVYAIFLFFLNRRQEEVHIVVILGKVSFKQIHQNAKRQNSLLICLFILVCWL